MEKLIKDLILNQQPKPKNHESKTQQTADQLHPGRPQEGSGGRSENQRPLVGHRPENRGLRHRPHPRRRRHHQLLPPRRNHLKPSSKVESGQWSVDSVKFGANKTFVPLTPPSLPLTPSHSPSKPTTKN